MGSMLPYIAAPWILWDRQIMIGIPNLRLDLPIIGIDCSVTVSHPSTN